MNTKTKLVVLQVLTSIFQCVALTSMFWAGYLVSVGRPNDPWAPFFVAMGVFVAAALIAGALEALKNKSPSRRG